MFRLMVALGLAACLLTPSLGVAQGQAPAGGAGKQAERGQNRRAKLDLWWNSPTVVAALKLSADQRKQMDRAWGAYSKAGGKTNVAKQQTALAKAFDRGDWTAAEAIFQTKAEEASAVLLAEGKMKVGVLKVLDTTQRDALATAYPLIAAQRWQPRRSWGNPRSADAPKLR